MIKSTQTHTSSWNLDISIWLSVDPLSYKYPHQSPYMFCSGNPVARVDMNGMEDGWVEDPSNPNKGTYWDPSVNTEGEAKAKGLSYKGQTVLATNSNGEVKYGDANGNWQDAVSLGEFLVSAKDKSKQKSGNQILGILSEQIFKWAKSNESGPPIENFDLINFKKFIVENLLGILLKRISSGKSNSNDPSGSEGNDEERGFVIKVSPNDSIDYYDKNWRYLDTRISPKAGKIVYDSHPGNDSIKKDTSITNTNGRRK